MVYLLKMGGFSMAMLNHQMVDETLKPPLPLGIFVNCSLLDTRILMLNHQSSQQSFAAGDPVKFLCRIFQFSLHMSCHLPYEICG